MRVDCDEEGDAENGCCQIAKEKDIDLRKVREEAFGIDIVESRTHAAAGDEEVPGNASNGA